MNCHLAAFDIDKSGSDMKRLQTEFKFEFPGWLSQQPVTNPEDCLGPKDICILCPVCFISKRSDLHPKPLYHALPKQFCLYSTHPKPLYFCAS